MNAFDQLGLGEVEQVVVAFEVLPPVAEVLAAIVRFGQLVLLDHRAHRTVDHDDAPAQELFEVFRPLCWSVHLRFCSRRPFASRRRSCAPPATGAFSQSRVKSVPRTI